MAKFITNLDITPASEEEVNIYYETATKEINALLAKYNILNSNGKLEELSADQFKALLSFASFFQSTPLRSIFFDQKQQFVPPEIIYVFRRIISDPPASIKAVFFNAFITLLTAKGWDKPLSAYFEKHYNVPSDGTIILKELKDFSFGSGVYRVTFQLRVPGREKITVFLKGSCGVQSRNELLYFHLQKQFLSTASYAKAPVILSNKENNDELLLSPLIPGAASDTILSKLTQAHRKTKHNEHKSILKQALEILIEAFLRHAALGDLLGRNDRHLMNSFIACVVDGIPQKSTLEDLNNPEKILAFANIIVTQKITAFSLIDFDLAWLLGEKNAGWILADIDFGLSELNLLSLFAEFNDYNSKTNPFYERRKEYVERYFNVYCQKQQAILEDKEILFSEIKKFYAAEISEEKLKILTQGIIFFERSKQPVFKMFERYLLNFRIRRVHKETLVALYKIAKESNNMDLLNALQEAELLKYLPPQSAFATSELNVFLQLQCFRGVLSKEDMITLSQERTTTWETIASNIANIAAEFNSTLFKDLQDKTQFIKNDTAELLQGLRSTATKDVKDTEYTASEPSTKATQYFANPLVMFKAPTTPPSSEPTLQGGKKTPTNASSLPDAGSTQGTI